MRLSPLLAPLLVGIVVAMPNPQGDLLASDNSNSPICGSHTMLRQPAAEAAVDQAAVQEALQANGQCINVKAGIPDYIMQGGCVCDFFSSAGCDKNPRLGSLVRSVTAPRQRGAAGDLPHSVKWYMCRHT